MKSYLAAAIQMNSQPDIEFNLNQAYELTTKAVSEGAEFVGYPENFSFLGDLKKRRENAELIAEKSYPFLQQTAREFGIYLLGGSYPMPAGNNKNYNRSILFGPKGKQLALYDKIHLFDVDLPGGESYKESDYVKPGKYQTSVHSSNTIGTIGLTVCYDLRFPELYRKIMEEKADVLTVPSAFTETTGKDHWTTLLRARAIENTVYVFAPAQTGLHGKNRRTYGHASIIDPWGKILADAGTETGFILAEISPQKISEVRTQIPSLKHRVLQ